MRHRWDPGRAFLWLWKCWDRAFRGRDLRRVRSEECGREWRGWLVGGKSSAQLGKEGPCVQGPPRGDPAGRGRLTTGPPEQRRGCRDGPKGILSVCCFLNHTPTPPLEQRVLLRPSDATMGLPSGASGRVLKDPPPPPLSFHYLPSEQALPIWLQELELQGESFALASLPTGDTKGATKGMTNATLECLLPAARCASASHAFPTILTKTPLLSPILQTRRWRSNWSSVTW